MTLRSIARSYAEVFSVVRVVPARRNPPDMDDNNLLVASDGPLRLPGAHEVGLSGSEPVLTDASIRFHEPWSLR